MVPIMTGICILRNSLMDSVTCRTEILATGPIIDNRTHPNHENIDVRVVRGVVLGCCNVNV